MKTIKGEELAGRELEVLEDGTLRLIENKNHGRYIPQPDEEYWYISHYGAIHSTANDSPTSDSWVIDHHLVFRTEGECEEYKKFLALLDEYKCELDWKDESENKHHLYYDWKTDKIKIDFNNIYQTQGSFYFKSMEDAKEFIAKAGEDNIKRFMFDVWE